MNDIVTRMILMGFGVVMFGAAFAFAVYEISVLLAFSECLMKGCGVFG